MNRAPGQRHTQIAARFTIYPALFSIFYKICIESINHTTWHARCHLHYVCKIARRRRRSRNRTLLSSRWWAWPRISVCSAACGMRSGWRWSCVVVAARVGARRCSKKGTQWERSRSHVWALYLGQNIQKIFWGIHWSTSKFSTCLYIDIFILGL